MSLLTVQRALKLRTALLDQLPAPTSSRLGRRHGSSKAASHYKYWHGYFPKVRCVASSSACMGGLISRLGTWLRSVSATARKHGPRDSLTAVSGSDNDANRHLYALRYPEYADSIANEFWLKRAGVDPASTTEPIVYAVGTQFSFFSSLAFPHPLLAALSCAKVGRSSVTLDVGIFAAEIVATDNAYASAGVISSGSTAGQSIWRTELKLASQEAAATGQSTHVFVDPSSKRPVPVPERIRQLLEDITSSQ